MKQQKIEKNQYFSRSLINYLQKWIDRKEIFAIKGPRQSGKTTLMRMLVDWLIEQKKIDKQNIAFFTFEDRETLEQFVRDPKIFLNSLIGDKKDEQFYIFLDEVHYLPNGGQILKLFYDTFDNIKFIISGSSSLELTSKTAKFLVGRVFSFELWPITFGEFLALKSLQVSTAYRRNHLALRQFVEQGKGFTLPAQDIFNKDLERYFNEYAVWGGYPAVVKTADLETKRAILKNIYETYIGKDIIELLRITDYSRFKAMTALLAARSGNLINYQNLARDSQSYFKEIKRYLSILEETYVIDLLKPFFKNKTSELKKNPMVYFTDNGLRNYIVGSFQEFSLRPDRGQLAENFVFSQLKFQQEDNYALKYWRTLSKAEVDFILEKRNGEILPIEVKYSPFSEPKISRSFRSFIEQYKPKNGLVLTKGFWGEMKVSKTKIKFVPIWYI